MDLAELLAQLNTLDKDAVVAALQQDAGANVKAFRAKVFAAGKTEGGASGKELKEQLETTEGELTTATARIEELTAKTPDKEAIERPWKEKAERAEAKHAKEIEALGGRIKTLQSSRDLAEFERLVARYIERGKGGAEVERTLDPDYARMKAREAASRFRYTDKDELEVLDEDGVPYATANGQPAYAALAREINKAAPAKWVVIDGDTGSGIDTGAAGTGSTYDPVKAGKAAADKQKASSGAANLAFK